MSRKTNHVGRSITPHVSAHLTHQSQGRKRAPMTIDQTTNVTADILPPDVVPQMTIDPLPEAELVIPIIGVTPLITHRFSEKSKLMMLDAAQGRKNVKELKDPEAEYQSAFYRLETFDGELGQPGMPATAFKLATVSASRFYAKSVTMVALRQCMFFIGQPGDDGSSLVPINGDPEMREDVVRVGRGGADLRYRPMFRDWSATLRVRVITSMLDPMSLVSIVDAGGLGVGVGEWRPEKDGTFGTYRIDQDRGVEVIG